MKVAFKTLHQVGPPRARTARRTLRVAARTSAIQKTRKSNEPFVERNNLSKYVLMFQHWLHGTLPKTRYPDSRCDAGNVASHRFPPRLARTPRYHYPRRSASLRLLDRSFAISARSLSAPAMPVRRSFEPGTSRQLRSGISRTWRSKIAGVAASPTSKRPS